MKRKMPASLITFLQNNRTCFKADLFCITLPTGQLLCATDGQWDITVPAGAAGWDGGQTTFKAVQYGVWKRGPITSEASAKVNAGTMSLTCVPQQGTQYPGLPVGLLNAALNHLFDGATVWVYTAYMPMSAYGDVSAGIETKWQGTITRAPRYSRNLVEFECADPLYQLNMKVPSRLLQSNCPWSFGDSNCGLNVNSYAVNCSAEPGSTQTQINSGYLVQPDGYFTQGVVTCLTGNNAGLSQTVKKHAGGKLYLMVPWLLPISVGDALTVIKGCDKTLPTCRATKRADGTATDNTARFGGTPFIPVPSASI